MKGAEDVLLQHSLCLLPMDTSHLADTASHLHFSATGLMLSLSEPLTALTSKHGSTKGLACISAYTSASAEKRLVLSTSLYSCHL